jgi:hypothetical protein
MMMKVSVRRPAFHVVFQNRRSIMVDDVNERKREWNRDKLRA